MFLRLLVVLLFLLSVGCGKSIKTLQRNDVTVTTRNVDVAYSPQTRDSVQIQYLGCGGLIIRYSDQAILIDPFFSNQPLLKIGCAMRLGTKICSDIEQIEVGRQRILTNLYKGDALGFKNETRAIFNAHGHYDHLMDIPYVHDKWFSETPEVYLSKSAFNAVKFVMDATRIFTIDDRISTHDLVNKGIEIAGSDGRGFVVYPIRGEHNPHTRKRKFFSGSVSSPSEEFKNPEDKTSIKNWLEGITVSFLIDVKKEEKTVFRIFVQSSSANYPNGLPPEKLLGEKAVDLAIMGVASYKFSENTYPCKYLETLDSAKIMFIHWEDFFRKYGRKPKTVLRTNVPRFFNEIFSKCETDYILPTPGVVVTLKK